MQLNGMMFSSRLLKMILMLLSFLLLTMPIFAQSSNEVYITTQDYVVLRLGPGMNWERLTVLDYGLTLRATGRNVSSSWIQVAYEGELPAEASSDGTIDGITYGWLSTRYLVWTGNVLELPIDGVQILTTARRSGSVIGLPVGATYYSGDNYFFEVAGVFDEPQTAEVTGRIGSGANGYYWLQFRLNGEYYWIPTWVVGSGGGNVLDASYLFPYGRLFNSMIRIYWESRNKLLTMNRRWNDLDAGFAATCNNIPEAIVFPDVLTTGLDLSREPVFTAPFNALTLARDNINIAIAQFEDVCNRDENARFATPEDVEIGQAALQEAQLQLNILDILLNPIGTQHPIANNE